ncbi:MAG: HPr family phosphocarrier protein [Hungatella sp.]|jgi:phosphotransferase system HPr (HPr) family protein|nr:HPr family phosphocarrier protein [Hungatella sp.]
MLKRKVILGDLEGIHARNSAKIVMICRDTEAFVRLEYMGEAADGGNILEIMSLKARYGDEILVTTDGLQEQKAMEEIEKVLGDSMI